MRWRRLATFLLVAGLVLLPSAFWLYAAARQTQDAQEAAPRDGRYVDAGDVRLFLQERGPADGAPVVLVHGTGAWSSMWLPTMEALAAEGYHAIALDLPPFGYSERPADASYHPPDQARRIAAALGSLALADVTLVGHSFGARATIEAALLAPERVGALVLVDPALDLDGAPDAPGPLVRALLATRPARELVVAATLTDPLATKPLLRALIANDTAATDARVEMLRAPLTVRGTTRAAGDWLADFLGAQPESASGEPAAYAGLTMPVLLLWGDLDDVTPLEDAEALRALVPHAQLEVIEGAGHIPQIEDEAAFQARLLAWLAGRPASGVQAARVEGA